MVISQAQIPQGYYQWVGIPKQDGYFVLVQEYGAGKDGELVIDLRVLWESVDSLLDRANYRGGDEADYEHPGMLEEWNLFLYSELDTGKSLQCEIANNNSWEYRIFEITDENITHPGQT